MTNPKDKLKNELTEKIEDNLSLVNTPISKSTQDVLSKIGIYSANFASELFSRIYGASASIGNAYGAIGFGTLDIILKNQDSLRKNKFNRLARVGGSLYYISACVYDLVSTLKGNYGTNLAEFVFDVSMAYQLDKDALKLYEQLNSKSSETSKLGLKDDLRELFESIKNKFPKKNLEENVSEKDNSKSFREYLSNFGKGIGYGFGYGIGSGYGFGEGAFEKLAETSKKLKENYSVYKTKRKEKNELKKIRDEKIKQERAEQKIKNAGFEEVSFKKKKEILEYLRQNPNFMRKYEIENEYSKFKQKPIKEQIQIMTDKKNSFNDELIQMKNAPWIKRFTNSSYVSYNKSALKRIEKILWKLDIEEKNLQPGIKKYL